MEQFTRNELYIIPTSSKILPLFLLNIMYYELWKNENSEILKKNEEKEF